VIYLFIYLIFFSPKP